MRNIFVNQKIKAVYFLFLIALSTSCVEESSDNSSSSSSGAPGVFEQPVNLRFVINVKDYDTNKPISQAVVEWDRINLGPGSIVYPVSGTTDASGKIDITIKAPHTVTSHNLNITRVFSPSGKYYGLSGNYGLKLQKGSIASTTFYLTPK